MALVKCRECSREVSSEAKACPHCGIADPAPKETEVSSSNPTSEDISTKSAGTPHVEPVDKQESIKCSSCGKPVILGCLKCSSCRELLPWITPAGLVVLLLFFCLILPAIGGLAYIYFSVPENTEQTQANNNDDYIRKLTLTKKEKGIICKAYISTAYGRSVNIIKHYKTDSEGSAYVKYRRDDGKAFKYVCDVEPNSIVYSMWDNDMNVWGRWRHDEAATYTLKDKRLTITDPMKGKKAFTLP